MQITNLDLAGLDSLIEFLQKFGRLTHIHAITPLDNGNYNVKYSCPNEQHMTIELWYNNS